MASVRTGTGTSKSMASLGQEGKGSTEPREEEPLFVRREGAAAWTAWGEVVAFEGADVDERARLERLRVLGRMTSRTP